MVCVECYRSQLLLGNEGLMTELGSLLDSELLIQNIGISIIRSS